MKILNAFSINMLPTESFCSVGFSPVPKDHVAKLAKSGLFQSAIGHKETADVLSSELGAPIPVNRETVKLKSGDEVIVAQYIGQRLPEGATSLPEGARIEYFSVVVDG